MYYEENDDRRMVGLANKVLVVEDDKNINEVVSEYLKESGYEVIAAADGNAALDIINSNSNIDMFILDIMLPHVSGLDLLKIIKGMDEFSETPVVMLTALNDEYTQIKSFDGLADDYITKPFSPRVLVKRVQALFRRSNGASNLIRLGDIAIDVESYEAYEHDKKLHLTLREFELLKVLMNNRNKVLSRQQLLNLVWGYDFFGDERIVDVHIKNLRKKFEANIISTIKGVGYRFEGGEA